jgi:hypothetical protein
MRKSGKRIQKLQNHYVYLLREREFIDLNEPIYKLGKTIQQPNTRLAGYPKGSEVLLFIDVKNCHSAEKALMQRFDSRYFHCKDIGREYYEGDLNSMKRDFFDVVSNDMHRAHPSYGCWAWLWRMIRKTFY